MSKPDPTLELPHVEGEYATPPVEPDRNTPEPDRLSRLSITNHDGWVRGYVEGAVGEIAVLWVAFAEACTAMGATGIGDALREGIAMRLAELRRRFGDADVDRQLQRVPELRSFGGT
jgi:hypothetical protein